MKDKIFIKTIGTNGSSHTKEVYSISVCFGDIISENRIFVDGCHGNHVRIENKDEYILFSGTFEHLCEIIRNSKK